MKEKQSETVKLDPQTEALFRRCAKLLKPPPSMTLSQWADTYRVLSAESNAAPGKWNTDNAPYQREIMDAIGDPHVRRVVIMSAAQIGKTAMLMNVLGYYMHYYPAPIMVMERMSLPLRRKSSRARRTPKATPSMMARAKCALVWWFRIPTKAPNTSLSLKA